VHHHLTLKLTFLTHTGIESNSKQPALGVVPAKHRDDHSRAAVLLGNMMVSDMAGALKRRKMAVQHIDDSAVVGDGEVIIRQGPGCQGVSLIIEGSLCGAFYEVRDEVYKQYRLVPS
jgi:hypothetical protein